MKRSLLLLSISIALISCAGGEPPAGDTATTSSATTASETSTAEGYVEKVTRAQEKAREMSAEEGERVKEVDDAMKDQ